MVLNTIGKLNMNIICGYTTLGDGLLRTDIWGWISWNDVWKFGATPVCYCYIWSCEENTIFNIPYLL